MTKDQLLPTLMHRGVITLIAVFVAASAAAGGEMASVRNLAPALDVTSPTGARSVIVGTFHLDMPDVVHQIATSEVGSFDRLIVEDADLSAVGGTSQQGSNSASADKSLTEAERAQVVEHLSCISNQGKPVSLGFARFLVTNSSAELLYSLVMTPCRADLARIKDQAIVRAARAANIPVISLDTAASRKALLAAIPARDGELDLKNVLTLDRDALFDRFFSAFNAGDYDALLEIGRSTYGPGYLSAMAEQRNLGWLPTLESELDHGHALVAVGAGHLGGPSGLISLLRNHGFTVAPTMLPAEPAFPSGN